MAGGGKSAGDVDFRQRSSSMYSVLNLVEYDQGFELPPHLVPGPYRDMMSTSVDLAAWVNDVYSIETFYDRRLRKHKVFGYLTPAETRQRHQHTLAA
ncbi:terpene synthase family protein [Streptomyces sp. NPDC018045]|uniref:terpene synthase family protein n=1 Tax=Streptomyces sp. NPDC018045 TaxID=3365037 RepID=UPI00379E8A34